MQGFAQDPSR